MIRFRPSIPTPFASVPLCPHFFYTDFLTKFYHSKVTSLSHTHTIHILHSTSMSPQTDTTINHFHALKSLLQTYTKPIKAINSCNLGEIVLVSLLPKNDQKNDLRRSEVLLG